MPVVLRRYSGPAGTAGCTSKAWKAIWFGLCYRVAKPILKKCVDLENEIRGLIRLLGIRLPGTLNHGAYDAVVCQAIETDGSMVDTLVPMLDARLVLYQTYLKLDNQVKALVREDPVCQRLMTVPGLGAITELTFKAAVDDPGRFKRSRTVAAHFGLTPRRFQSGELDNPGRISKAGDLLAIFIQSTGVTCTPVSPDEIPSLVKIGDFGILSDLLCDDNTTQSRNWRIEDGRNGNIKAITAGLGRDNFNNPVSTTEVTNIIDVNNVIVGFNTVSELSNGFTLTYQNN